MGGVGNFSSGGVVAVSDLTDSDDDATVRTDLVIEDVDLHPEERDAIEQVVQQMADGGRAFVLPNDASREKRELFEAVVDVCRELDGVV